MRVAWSAVCLVALAGWQMPAALEPPCPAGSERRQEYVGDGYATACWTPAGLKEGPYRIVHVNGTLVADGHFEANRPAGSWTTWYSNGQKQDEGAYRAGQRWGW